MASTTNTMIRYAIKKRIGTFIVFAVAAVTFSACGERPSNAPIAPANAIANIVQPDVIVVDASQWLDEGKSASWKVEPGNYKLEMTASDDGATVEWIGATCAKTKSMRQLTTTCKMTGLGQLIVTNPSVFHLGKRVSVTVRLTKLAR